MSSLDLEIRRVMSPGLHCIQVRTLEGIDLDALHYRKFDGKSL